MNPTGTGMPRWEMPPSHRHPPPPPPSRRGPAARRPDCGPGAARRTGGGPGEGPPARTNPPRVRPRSRPPATRPLWLSGEGGDEGRFFLAVLLLVSRQTEEWHRWGAVVRRESGSRRSPRPPPHLEHTTPTNPPSQKVGSLRAHCLQHRTPQQGADNPTRRRRRWAWGASRRVRPPSAAQNFPPFTHTKSAGFETEAQGKKCGREVPCIALRHCCRGSHAQPARPPRSQSSSMPLSATAAGSAAGAAAAPAPAGAGPRAWWWWWILSLRSRRCRGQPLNL